MLSLSLIYAIVAVGLNVTNGYLGMLNLSVGGQVAIGCYACAILALKGVPLPLAIGAAVVVGAAVAGLIFVIFARLHGFFFGLATIAAAEVIRLLIRNLDGLTNGVRGLRGFPQLTGSPETTYLLVVACLRGHRADGGAARAFADRLALARDPREPRQGAVARHPGAPLPVLGLRHVLRAGSWRSAARCWCRSCNISSRTSPASARWCRPC